MICFVTLTLLQWPGTKPKLSELHLYYYFLDKLFQHMALRGCDFCVMSVFPQPFFKHFFALWHQRMFQDLLVFLFPNPGIDHFHKKPSVRSF